MFCTQSGKQCSKAMALLKLLALGERDIKAGRTLTGNILKKRLKEEFGFISRAK